MTVVSSKPSPKGRGNKIHNAASTISAMSKKSFASIAAPKPIFVGLGNVPTINQRSSISFEIAIAAVIGCDANPRWPIGQ